MGDAKTRPIPFSGEMVRTILDGRKTQTRRPYKPRWGYEMEERDDGGMWPYYSAWADGDEGSPWLPSPFGAPGDLLRVVSTWGTTSDLDAVKPSSLPRDARIWTVADGERPAWVRKMRPGRFMPLWMRERMPLLENRDVRVQRVQDITEEDARAEGVYGTAPSVVRASSAPFARERFEELWRDIYGAASWDANPWVWAVTFRRVP